MPIYQCISYLNDSFHDELEAFGIKPTQQKNDKQKHQNQEKEESAVDNKNIKKENTDLPTITIYSWGNKIRKKAPMQSQHNTNVCGVVGYSTNRKELI